MLKYIFSFSFGEGALVLTVVAEVVGDFEAPQLMTLSYYYMLNSE